LEERKVRYNEKRERKEKMIKGLKVDLGSIK
jgi:hypothetical protein